MDQSRPVPGVRLSIARRMLDVLVATLGLVLALPVMLLAAVAIKLDSKGPLLYRQRRIGEGARHFTMLKFRTMQDHSDRFNLTPPGDTRVTRVGRLLRASCLDELPQLFNVIAGDMTLVGPRPQIVELAAKYPEHLRVIFRYRPGITGPGVLMLNDDDVLPNGVPSTEVEAYYLREIIPRRIVLDLEYLDSPTFARTVGFLLSTFGHVASRVFGRVLGGARRTRSVELASTPVPVKFRHIDLAHYERQREQKALGLMTGNVALGSTSGAPELGSGGGQ